MAGSPATSLSPQDTPGTRRSGFWVQGGRRGGRGSGGAGRTLRSIERELGAPLLRR